MFTHRMHMLPLASLTQTFVVKRALSDGVLSVPDAGAGFPGKRLFAQRSTIDGASTTPQMIWPSGSDQGSETASVDAGEVTLGVIQEYDWELDTAPQEVWVADGSGADGLRKSFPTALPPSARSSKVTFRIRCAARLRHPHRFGEDCNGSSGLHRRWSRLAENVHSAHGFYHPAASLNLFPLARPDGRRRSTLGRLVAQLSRQWSPEGNVRSAGAVCARRVDNHCTSRIPTDLQSLKRCQPAPDEVSPPSADLVFFFSEPCLIQISPAHPALSFFDTFRLMKVHSHGRLSFAFCVWSLLSSCVGFLSREVWGGMSEECDTTPCAPKVAPSLWTLQTKEPSCDTTTPTYPARCCVPARHSR